MTANDYINVITTIVSTLGFPICMCIALFWYMIKQNEMHGKESRQMREAITSLEIAITKLTSHFTKEDDNE